MLRVTRVFAYNEDVFLNKYHYVSNNDHKVYFRVMVAGAYCQLSLAKSWVHPGQVICPLQGNAMDRHVPFVEFNSLFFFWGGLGIWENTLVSKQCRQNGLLIDRICTDTWVIWANLDILPLQIFCPPQFLINSEKQSSIFFFFVNLIFLIKETELFVLFYTWIQYACINYSCKSENISCSSSAKSLKLSQTGGEHLFVSFGMCSTGFRPGLRVSQFEIGIFINVKHLI